VGQQLSLSLLQAQSLKQRPLFVPVQQLLEQANHLRQAQGELLSSAQESQLMPDLEQLLLPGLESQSIAQAQQLLLSQLELLTR
jgi:hypothetical protein